MHNKGFTMIEMLIVLAMISLFTTIALPLFNPISVTEYEFVYDYLIKQASSMVSYTQTEYTTKQGIWHNYAIRFNSRGHINRAQTVTIEKNKAYKEYIIELGGGRLVRK